MAHTNFLFTSESVSEGHPDKVCDQISDAVLDAFLENDIKLGIADDSLVNTRLGCETLATTNKIVIAGEGRGQAPLFRKHDDKVVVDRELITKIARDVVRDLGYDQDGFSYYGADVEVLLHAEIEPKTGDLRLTRHMLVVEAVENPSNQITLDEARKRHPAAQVGDTIADPLPPLEYGRIAAQSAKQVIVQKVREAERDRQYAEYKDRIGDIVNGIVKRVEYGNVVVDLGRGEAIVRRDEMLPREVFRNGDRIRAYIYDVRREPRGPQIFLSRTHPQFTAKLFAQEVPEIYDGIVEVKAVARDPGSRAKIAVISRDSSVDPVGACVGMITIPEVRVSSDLRLATIYVMPLGGRDAETVVAAFERHKKFLRAEIAHRINLKFAPDIRFRVDDRFAEAERIDKLLRSPDVQRDLKRDEDSE